MSQEGQFNGESLYKIGTGWVFDINTYVGYKVVRKNNKADGDVQRFDKAFSLFKEADSWRVEYTQKVPMGTIRKAVQLMEKQDKGLLGGIYE